MNNIDTSQSLSECKKFFKSFNFPFKGEVYKLTSSFFNRDGFVLRVIALKKTKYGHLVYAVDQNTNKEIKLFSNTRLENIFEKVSKT